MAKEYILKSGDSDKSVPKPFNARLRETRDTDVLIGICKGIIADGKVNEAELAGLKAWFSNHVDVRRDVIGKAIFERISRIYEDGVVSFDEKDDFAVFLEQIVGGTPAQEHSSIAFLCSPPPVVVFENNHFCFTGRCASGSRSWCQLQVLRRYGIIDENVVRSTRFLVIGELGSGEWKHPTYGNKIEKAAEQRKEGLTHIIAESHWLKYLDETPMDGDDI